MALLLINIKLGAQYYFASDVIDNPSDHIRFVIGFDCAKKLAFDFCCGLCLWCQGGFAEGIVQCATKKVTFFQH